MLYTSTKVRWKYRAGIEHLKMKGVDIGRFVTFGYVTWISILPHLCMESHHQRGLGVEQQAQSRSPEKESKGFLINGFIQPLREDISVISFLLQSLALTLTQAYRLFSNRRPLNC